MTLPYATLTYPQHVVSRISDVIGTGLTEAEAAAVKTETSEAYGKKKQKKKKKKDVNSEVPALDVEDGAGTLQVVFTLTYMKKQKYCFFRFDLVFKLGVHKLGVYKLGIELV